VADIFGFAEIDVVPVRRKGEAEIIRVRGRDDFASRYRGHIAQPKLCCPFSSVTLNTYFPSGDIAAPATLPESVTRVTVNFWKGAGAGRCSRE